MAKCFSFTASRDSCYRYSFIRKGLKSCTTDLGDGTIMHCWVPKSHSPTKPSLVLIHGFGANAMWQFNDFIPPLKSKFNIYVPDLLFFGDSYTTRPERSEAFQAQCVMALMDRFNVKTMDLMGLSYGGFVSYSMAAQFKERVGRVVLCCAGVCLEEKDLEEGLFKVKNVDEAVDILLPKSPDKVRELMRLAFYKPPPNAPSCFLSDFIQVMCTEYREEKRDLIYELHKGRKLSNLPKITQPTLIIWGEYDHVFPVELGHRLKRHLGENAELVIIKNAGHALNAEKVTETYKHLKSFLIDTLPRHQQNNYSNGHKTD
ncbi:alpha/beta-Hydrolases superfamily protein [Euphorbia peplus]|nr:alpha/beta-Hydrolases superfamily protein [Euphorbia peplus]